MKSNPNYTQSGCLLHEYTDSHLDQIHTHLADILWYRRRCCNMHQHVLLGDQSRNHLFCRSRRQFASRRQGHEVLSAQPGLLAVERQRSFLSVLRDDMDGQHVISRGQLIGLSAWRKKFSLTYYYNLNRAKWPGTEPGNKKSSKSFSDLLLSLAAPVGGWYSVLKVRFKLARQIRILSLFYYF